MNTLCTTWVCVGALLLAGCGSFASRETTSRETARRESAATANLASHMAERLFIAREVAWTKAHSGAAVSDPQREATLLAALVKQGEAAGLEAGRVRRFFVAQIAASREVQTELLAAWAAGKAERPQTPPLDLRKQIRPRMDTVSAALLAALAAFPDAERTTMFRAEIGERLRDGGFSDAVVALALDGL